MEMLGMILLVIGLLISAVGSIWLLIEAFQESILWGLGCVLVPFIPLIFLVMHWSKCAKPTMVMFAVTVLAIIGVVLVGMGNA
jgi:FtsH-binding integral membrane protein